MNDLPVMLTVKECCKRTGLSYQYLLGLCKTGKIIAVKSGNKYLVNSQKLSEYLNTGDCLEAHDFDA